MSPIGSGGSVTPDPPDRRATRGPLHRAGVNPILRPSGTGFRRLSPAERFISVVAPAPDLYDDEAVRRVLTSGRIGQGPEVEAFEREFRSRFELAGSWTAVNSGTTALQLGMRAARIGRGDEVIIPSFAAPAVATAVALTGATPIFADIDPHTYGLDPRSVRSRVTPRTVAIVAVHLFGHPADMPALRRIADQQGLILVEDAAHAHGAGIAGRPVGSFGTLAAFSFGPSANLTTGEGGMVGTHISDLHARLRRGRSGLASDDDDPEIFIGNVRMTDVQAAIGRAQLGRLGVANRRRAENAAFLSRHLTGVRTPRVRTGYRPVFQQYVVRVERNRDRLQTLLRSRYNIASTVPYSRPLHRRRAFASSVHLPETDRAVRECLSLPVHPGLSRSDLDRIVEAVHTLTASG